MNRLFIWLAFVATALPVNAIPIRVLPWDEETAARKLAIGVGKEIIEIGYMHPAARSAPIKLPAGTEGLRLVANDRTNDDGTPASVPFAVAEGIKNPLLLIIPDKDSKAGVTAMVLDDGGDNFKWGTIRLINVTSKPMVFRWGKETRELPPGRKVVDVEPGGKTRNIEVFLYPEDNPINPLYSAIWGYREDMRKLVFVIPSPDASRETMAFKFVPETRLPEGSAPVTGAAP